MRHGGQTGSRGEDVYDQDDFCEPSGGRSRRSVAFYRALGAEQNRQFTDATASMMVFSEAINVMLLTHEKFRQFTPKEIADARRSTEVLLALSAESRGDVDDAVRKAEAAGGNPDPGPKQDHGFMYGRSFEDPDGHIWEVVWMDVDAAQAGAEARAGA